VRTFCGQGGRGQFFTILCGRPLWMTPYIKVYCVKGNSHAVKNHIYLRAK